MAIYTPGYFVGADDRIALQLMTEYPFATLLTTTAGEPQITHLPLLWEDGALFSHFATRADE